MVSKWEKQLLTHKNLIQLKNFEIFFCQIKFSQNASLLAVPFIPLRYP